MNRVNKTVNIHLTVKCNLNCKFCFAGFIGHRNELSKENVFRLVELCAEYFDRINFAGGEPTLVKKLPDYAQKARDEGMEVSLITNGLCIIDNIKKWRSQLPFFDMVGISIDSLIPEINRFHGRCRKGKALDLQEYYEILLLVKEVGIKLKINTVVSKMNYQEDLSELICHVKPFRWKVFQLLPVKGENDACSDLYTSSEEFNTFVQNHQNMGLSPVVEENNQMRGSYYMISPDGRFFDNTSGNLHYSEPILDIGIEAALAQISFDKTSYESRGGDYSLKGNE